MATYLLLRSNKQTGPYSLNELAAFGLKPYDLVWINGKSAAWRYPSEIEELKSYAPAAEEQPYDRFYKKPAQPQKNIPVIQEKEIHADNIEIKTTAEEIKIEKPEAKANNVFQPVAGGALKQVFISMPQSPLKVVPETKPAPVQQIPAEYQTYLPAENKTIVPEEEKVIRLEKRFSQPLDEIKDMYVQTLVDRKKKIARSNFFRKNIKNIAIVFLILALGVVMGFAFQNSNKKVEILASANTPSQQAGILPQVTDTITSSSSLNTENEMLPEENENLQVETDQQQLIQQPSLSLQEKLDNMMKKSIAEKSMNKAVTKEQQTEIVAEKENIPVIETPLPADRDPISGERKKVMRNERENSNPVKDVSNTTPVRSGSSKAVSKEDVWKQVTVKASNYITGPFGGIKDLYLTVSNNTQIPIDKVEVEVKYIGMEQQVVKTQTMIFNDLAPGSQMRAEVPRTNRGMSVAYSIKKISSREPGMAKSDF